MALIPDEEVVRSVRTENPWWTAAKVSTRFRELPKRDYFEPFVALTTNMAVTRAVILMGPRRVGKTVMTQQLVQALIEVGVDPKAILYASIDTPTYTGLGLQYFVDLLLANSGKQPDDQHYLIFDEIQYLPAWERHLKVLVDRYPRIKFVASGSAAAALKLASDESGAGRFTDFMLPPLTFAEYLRFIGKLSLIHEPSSRNPLATTDDISALNDEFQNYINFGGYPEAVMNKDIRSDAARFIKSDIIDKVLLRDLPQLYGITNIQELNKLFTYLAYQSGQETSFQSLAQQSNGISKPTIERYIEYLEAAFLIFRMRRVDDNARTFSRDRSFKVFLTNPSMRAALFSPLDSDSPSFGHLAETAVLSQWFHADALGDLHYARWKERGQTLELDIIYLAGALRPEWVAEIKWSDRDDEINRAIHTVKQFRKGRDIPGTITTRTKSALRGTEKATGQLVPTALYCFTVGRNTPKARVQRVHEENAADDDGQSSLFEQ